MNQTALFADADLAPLEVAEEDAPIPQRTQAGDLWALGDHRLLVGDATDPADITRLMNGRRASMAFTDPPYNVNLGEHGGAQRKTNEVISYKTGEGHKVIANDTMPPEEWDAFCRAWARNLLQNVDGALYICMSSKELGKIMSILQEEGGYWSNTLIWQKVGMAGDDPRFTLGRADYQHAYEPIWYGWREGFKNHYWCGDRDQDDIWRFALTNKRYVGDFHPTMKPIPLCRHAIENSSEPGDIVLDLFLGSGSTLIAAEGCRRICYGSEIETIYADRILFRWEKMTGETAVKL